MTTRQLALPERGQWAYLPDVMDQVRGQFPASFGRIIGYRPDGRPIRAIGGGSAKTYLIHNSAMATTAAPVKQPTGTAIRTMMQLAPATGVPIRVIQWGCSLDSYATAGQVELIDTGTVFATALSTAYAVADIQPHNDPNAPANTSGTSGVPLNLGTGLSGFATGSVTEGSTTASKMKDLLLNPAGPYVSQFPLGREPEIPAGDALRVRMTFGTSVNAYIYVVIEV